MFHAAPQAILDLWPTPALGDWAVRDVRRPIPVAGGDGFRVEPNNLEQREIAQDTWSDSGIGQPVDMTRSLGDQYRARRGSADRGTYGEQTYNKVVPHTVTHSLGRETLYNWADAQFNVGGVTYPHDYGFGPGFHGDAADPKANPQVYMRPGIWINRTKTAV